MKKYYALITCAAMILMPHMAQAGTVYREYDPATQTERVVEYRHCAKSDMHCSRVDAYNNDVESRNRAEGITGSNMGPGGRNSGFDANTGLHSSSGMHINRTAIDGSDNYRAHDRRVEDRRYEDNRYESRNMSRDGNDVTYNNNY